MNVSVAELRAITEKLLAHLEQKAGVQIEISMDHYWSVAKDQRYDSYQQPTELDVGQLSDDWAELQKINQGISDPTSFALVWLSTILRAVGEEIVE